MRLPHIKKLTSVAISTTVGVYFRQFRYDTPPELLQTCELSDLSTARRSAGFGMTVAHPSLLGEFSSNVAINSQSCDEGSLYGDFPPRFSSLFSCSRQRYRAWRADRFRGQSRPGSGAGARAADQRREGHAERLSLLLGRLRHARSTPSTARSSTSKAIRAARTTRERSAPRARRSFSCTSIPTVRLRCCTGARRDRLGSMGPRPRDGPRSPSWSRRPATRRSSRNLPTASSSNDARDLRPRRRHAGIEFNHIQQKLMRGLGIVAIENQARI